MHILLAPDKFKGSLNAREVCEALDRGLKRGWEEIRVTSFPLADGGEGTANLLTRHAGGVKLSARVTDPFFRPVMAGYGYCYSSHTAYIDMSEASGLWRLHEDERRCIHATTLGTGQLILKALAEGSKKIILGIGGSAGCEGGIGMARALGWHFFDANGHSLRPTGRSLKLIRDMVPPEIPQLRGAEMLVAVDVRSPLTGPMGAARIFAPQKGANEDEVKELEEGLEHLAERMQHCLGLKLANIPGGGAAGGLGAGLVAFAGAELRSGIELVMTETRFAEAMGEADLVISGEGKLDSQSLEGKVVSGVSRMAKSLDVPAFAVCGVREPSETLLDELGLAGAFELNPVERSQSTEVRSQNRESRAEISERDLAATGQRLEAWAEGFAQQLKTGKMFPPKEGVA